MVFNHHLPDILTIEDLVEIDPNRGEFLIKLQDLVNQKQNMVNESEWDELTLNMGGLSQDQEGTLNNVKVEDLGLTFQYSPSSRIFGLDEGINLIPEGDNELVTIGKNKQFHDISVVTKIISILLKNKQKIC